MSSRFSFSPAGRGETDPWFRIGTVDVTTTMAVVLMSVASIVLFAFGGLALQEALAMRPSAVMEGQLWRLVTWPFANPGISIWTILNIFFLWYFGTDLEATIGRVKMLWMLIGFQVSITVVALAVGLLMGVHGYLATVGPIELMVLLTWIAEYPTRRFFFNIPAWVFGAVIVALQVISALGLRDWFSLISLLLGMVLCALVARSVGLLSEQTWIPNLGRGGRTRQPKTPRYRPGSPTVVSGPWTGSPAPAAPRRSMSDQARLDELLDKISERGIDGLSDAERKELLKLRDKRTRG